MSADPVSADPVAADPVSKTLSPFSKLDRANGTTELDQTGPNWNAVFLKTPELGVALSPAYDDAGQRRRSDVYVRFVGRWDWSERRPPPKKNV